MEFNFNFEELKKKASAIGQSGLNMAQSGMDKGIQMASIAKLKAANAKEESDLRAAYIELGKMYYNDHGAEPEEAYAAVCSQIADIQATIAANNAKIAEIKVASDAEAEVEVEVEVEVEEEGEPAEEAEAPAEESAEEPAAEEPVVEKASEAAEDDSDYGFTD